MVSLIIHIAFILIYAPWPTKKTTVAHYWAMAHRLETSVLWEVVDIVNSIRKIAKQQRLFSKLCNKMVSTSKKLILHSEVRWLSPGKVLSRVFQLREQLEAYCTEQGTKKLQSSVASKISLLGVDF